MTYLSISVTETPLAEDLAIVGGQLTAFNEADVGPADRRPLAVLVRDAAGTVVAGISGYTAWGWLYVQWLWVAETQRGAGLAGRMLAAAETDAKARGCHGAYIDTFSPVALKTYQRAGYVPFGALEDFPPGRTRTFLQKRL
ncbi:MAG TPA: GNAT family N-acetyltransferase [Devosia sp.]|jgi:GNAT superfamily N-acetyltransferase|uniref:GNAT family N-acetyltransferase n=1 Tax=Devosia sp. TaxID=1871048 RepID=UPI002DDD47C1|nr:GNAT family N-acetyltransferase [Devosia sp.]HEV2515286.1 GNAT family N-acetyltransferase [Devosia sp.]